MTNEERKALEDLIEAVEAAINAKDWKVDGACDPTLSLIRAKEALAQPDQYAKGYADAMNWKVQNHLEHLPAAQPKQKPVAWKLVPIKPTRKMLEAMDECSIEGYDEHLYAGHAASVYMAAVDVAPSPPQPKEPEQEPVAKKMTAHRAAYFMERFKHEEKLLGPNEQAALEFVISMLEAQPEQEPVAWMLEGWGPDCGPYFEIYRDDEMGWRNKKEWTPLYTTPPQRTWVGLTDEEIQKKRHLIDWTAGWSYNTFARAIEAKLKELNT